jgi:hypothetical protein
LQWLLHSLLDLQSTKQYLESNQKKSEAVCNGYIKTSVVTRSVEKLIFLSYYYIAHTEECRISISKSNFKASPKKNWKLSYYIFSENTLKLKRPFMISFLLQVSFILHESQFQIPQNTP